MEGVSFPQEARGFAAIEQSLEADLSLSQIEKIGEQIVNTKTTDKTREVGLGLLNRLESKRDALVNQKLAELNQTSNLVSKIKQLQPLIYFLPPEEIDRQLSAIEMDASLLSGQDQKLQESVQQQLDHLRLSLDKPIFQELDANTPHGFAAKAKEVANAVLRTGSLAPLAEGFNAVQLREVCRAAAGTA